MALGGQVYFQAGGGIVADSDPELEYRETLDKARALIEVLASTMILLIDNYDSFVYNLARYVRELGETPVVRRHDALTVDEILADPPSHIIISPGPCSPLRPASPPSWCRGAGPTIPILGVCLGHQCIGAAYGGEIVRAGRPMHGKTSRIHHRGTGLFTGLPSPFRATRYHSLVIAPASVPPELEVVATSEDGEIMAVQHARASGVRGAVPPRVGAHRARLSPARSFPARRAGDAPVAAARGRRRAGGPRGRPAHARHRPAARGSGPVIIETIVTTMDPDGAINFAPMGVEWGEETIVLKPFLETTTYRNVRATGVAVVNLTDDAMLFAQGAISSPQFPWVPATVVRGAVLEAACSWREIEVGVDRLRRRRARGSRPGCVHAGTRREFLGFNRARHAVLEAAILATRTHLHPAGADPRRNSRGCR